MTKGYCFNPSFDFSFRFQALNYLWITRWVKFICKVINWIFIKNIYCNYSNVHSSISFIFFQSWSQRRFIWGGLQWFEITILLAHFFELSNRLFSNFVYAGNVVLIEKFSKDDVDLNIQQENDGKTPVFLAAQNGKIWVWFA